MTCGLTQSIEAFLSNQCESFKLLNKSRTVWYTMAPEQKDTNASKVFLFRCSKSLINEYH